MGLTTTRGPAKSRIDPGAKEVLEAQRAYEEELLVGMTIDLVNALVDGSGISQRELAKRLGVSEGRVSQILSGRENVSLRKLADLAWSLGVRFEIVPVALEDRRGTPAANDVSPPSWIDKLRRQRLRHHSGRGGEAARI
jgi:transcriptional regulator with XRE-family HTH domain